MMDSMTADLTDTRIALRNLYGIVQWLLVRDKKRLGDQDVKKMLREIDLNLMLLSDESAKIDD